MTLLDLMIIYFACGSPLAVYLLSDERGGPTFANIITTALKLVVWPPVALLLAIRGAKRHLADPAQSLSRSDIELTRLRSALEAAAVHQKSDVSVFDLREVFDRYAALCWKATAAETQPPAAEIFDITEHPAPTLAAACLSRRNRSCLLLHGDDARKQFVEIISRLSTESSHFDAIASSSIETAEIVGDIPGAAMLRSALGLPERVVDKLSYPERNRVWHDHPHRQPVVD